MFVELLTENVKPKRRSKQVFRKITETKDPAEILRANGIKIKKQVPYKNCIEFSFFDNINSLNFKCLNSFDIKIKDGKLFVFF